MASRPHRQAGAGPPADLQVDPAGVPGARPGATMPRFVQPELATLVEEAPGGDRWAHEIKFDGYRILARIERGSVTMYSRNDKDWTAQLQVLAGELAGLPVQSAMLDGEVVAQLPDGTTSFRELRSLLGAGAAAAGRGGATKGLGGRTAAPRSLLAGRLRYYVFDLLHLNGFDLLEAPLEGRRDLLRRVLAQTGEGSRVLFSDDVAGTGPVVLEQACALGLEGVVSKKSGSRYRPGVRGPDWVKTKCRQEQEFVIGGYTDPAGGRTGFGALLLGVQTPAGLRYVSKVGTGFDEALLRSLATRLRGLKTDTPPFVENLPKALRSSHWVRPELVAQVAFMEWTDSGGIRHASFKGLREDKPAAAVVAETSAETPAGATAP